MYGGIMDVCFTALVLALLMTIAMIFDVLEVFSAVVIGGGSGGMWLLGNVFAVCVLSPRSFGGAGDLHPVVLQLQQQRENFAETPLAGADFEARLWSGGVLCWVSCLCSLSAATLYFVE